MDDAELSELEASNDARLKALTDQGVNVAGLDLVRLLVAVESLMSSTQHRAYRETWAGRMAGIMDASESAVTRARLQQGVRLS